MLDKNLNGAETLEKRQQWVLQYKNSDMKYLENCTFLDEADLNLHILRDMGWSEIGTSVNIDVLNQRGISISVLGAVSIHGDINVIMPECKPVGTKGTEKKKVPGASKFVTKRGDGGTKSGHFQKFVEEALDLIDCYDVQ